MKEKSVKNKSEKEDVPSKKYLQNTFIYSFARVTPKRILTEQFPVIVFSFIIAEFFFKFKSFTLECLAFLAVWFVTDLVVQYAKQRIKNKPSIEHVQNEHSDETQ